MPQPWCPHPRGGCHRWEGRTPVHCMRPISEASAPLPLRNHDYRATVATNNQHALAHLLQGPTWSALANQHKAAHPRPSPPAAPRPEGVLLPQGDRQPACPRRLAGPGIGLAETVAAQGQGRKTGSKGSGTEALRAQAAHSPGAPWPLAGRRPPAAPRAPLKGSLPPGAPLGSRGPGAGRTRPEGCGPRTFPGQRWCGGGGCVRPGPGPQSYSPGRSSPTPGKGLQQ